MFFLLLALGTAQAASLDNLEMGGVFGTPLATNPTAVWWNPAGLAAAGGTRLFIEGEPTFATVEFERDDPYNGGADTYRFSGVVPFAGLATDLGVDGLGLGIGFGVPYARGGAEPEEPGTGSFAMRKGSIMAMSVMGSAAYQVPTVPISLGVGAILLQSSWVARLDSELTTSYDEDISAAGSQSGYTDAQIENPDYATTLQYSTLSDTALAFNAGLRLDLDKVSVGAGYTHGARIDNVGDVDLFFGCPPAEDEVGRFGAETLGLCDSVIHARGSVGYRLPSRVHGGLSIHPTPKATVELMGGAVFWGQYTDFDVKIYDVDVLNDLENEETASKVNLERKWARANKNTWWAGIDAKGDIGEHLTLGARVLFDNSAIPDFALSPNNYDADAVSLSGLVAAKPSPTLTLGLQVQQQLLATRVIESSAFGVTLDDDAANEDRWFYPQMNGTYSASITRVGISAQMWFGAPKD